jgi:ComF family protein
MLDQVDRWLSRIAPRHCLLCDLISGHRYLCPGCLGDLPWLGDGCRRCAAPLPPDGSPGLCAGCDLALDGVARYRAAVAYEYPVDQLIAAAKFRRRPELARALGEMLARALRAQLATTERPDCLAPMPLHPLRLARRGFNQAEEIARVAARELRIPMRRDLCRRRRHTPPQTSRDGDDRRRGMAGAFAVHPSVAGLRIAIVDDVVTTGSTCSALAVEMDRAGASLVEAWSAARVLVQPAAKV